MEPLLPEDPAELRALLPEVVSLIRSGRAALEADLAGLGAHAPAVANTTESSAAEFEREESPAALQQLIRKTLKHWYQQRSRIEAAIAGAKDFARAGQYYYPRFLETQEADALTLARSKKAPSGARMEPRDLAIRPALLARTNPHGPTAWSAPKTFSFDGNGSC